MVADQKNITPEPEEETNGWDLDPEPEESTEKFRRVSASEFEEEPQEDVVEESDEESDEEMDIDEITASLGFQKPRWVVPASIGGGAILVIIAVWFISGILFKSTPELPDSLAVVESDVEDTTEVVNADESSTDTSDTLGDSESQVVSEKMETPELASRADGEKTDTVGVIETFPPEDKIESMPLAWMTEDDFFMLLNAQVSKRESAVLQDEKKFQEMLFTPMDGYTPAQAQAQAQKLRLPIFQPAESEKPDTVKIEVDTMIYIVAIDSLEMELAMLRLDLAGNRDSTAILQRTLNSFTGERDSIQQAEIKRLAKIINVMEPAYAANMLRTRSNDEVTEILFRLKPRNAAKVLQQMPLAKRREIAMRVMKQ